MRATRKALCLAYGLIAVLALVGTWGNNLGYLKHLSYWEATLKFLEDALASRASRSLMVDILFLGFAVFVWMVFEARRLDMKFVWLYWIFGIVIAFSVTVPIFLINRERALVARDSSTAAGTLSPRDVVVLVAMGLAIVGYAGRTLVT